MYKKLLLVPVIEVVAKREETSQTIIRLATENVAPLIGTIAYLALTEGSRDLNSTARSSAIPTENRTPAAGSGMLLGAGGSVIMTGVMPSAITASTVRFAG